MTFGVTIYAVSTVVAAFMGGLALGSFLGGRWADRVGRPILWYAAAELLIGLMGIAAPAALSWVQATYLALYPREASQAALAVVALRFTLASLVLLVPTTLMGATLPLIVKASLPMDRSIGARVSWLYASNTAGAVLGTIAGGFFLIGSLGIRGAIAVAVALNLTAALSALALSSAVRHRQPEAVSADAQPGDTSATHRLTEDGSPRVGSESRLVRRLVTIAFAVQGLASLAYEVIWTRRLALLLDGSTYAFSIVLATVLLGITLGSAMVSPLMMRRLPWVRLYALLATGVAACALLGIVVFARIYEILDRLGQIAFVSRAVDSHVGWMVLAALATILPPMLLLGASFPIAARVVVSGRARAGAELGGLYAGNTAGAILGAWTAGFLLLPQLGSQRSIELVAVINALLAIGLALASGPRRLLTAGAGAALILGSFALVLALSPDMYGQMVGGRFAREVVWVGEGRETSVAVVRNRDTDRLDMFLNGQGQASDESETVWFHQLLGHLPMTLHPDPRDVMIVGIGGGTTAGALAQHGPSRMDVIELSDTVVEGARHFNHVNGDVLHYPNLHLTIDDGRNYLLLTDRRYDIITADVIHPRNAGSAVLYSYEYYELARKVLKPGGIMAQWLEDRPENPDNDAQRRLMARTFMRAFPHATMWAFGELLIGSTQPVDISVETLGRRWRQRNLDLALAGTRLGSPETFRSLLNMSEAELRAWAGDGPLMTDNHPYIEYFLSLPGGNPGWRGRTTPTHPG